MNSQKGFSLVEGIIVAVILLLVLCIAIAPHVGDAGKADSLRIIENDGCSQVQTTGYKWFCCGKEDMYSNGFTAVKNGKTVNGCVCGGWNKGWTIRYQ